MDTKSKVTRVRPTNGNGRGKDKPQMDVSSTSNGKTIEGPLSLLGKGFVAMIPLFVVVLTAWLGFYFNDIAAQRTSDITADDVARKSLADAQEKTNSKQSAVYDSAVEVTGNLSNLASDEYNTNKHSKTYVSLKGNFDVLYWSKLPAVGENKDVVVAMIQFGAGLDLMENPADFAKNLPKRKDDYITKMSDGSFNFKVYDMDNGKFAKDTNISKNPTLYDRTSFMHRLAISLGETVEQAQKTQVKPVSYLRLMSENTKK